MSLEGHIELLGSTSLFRGLSDEELSLIVRHARKSFFQQGESLIEEGVEGRTAYMILSGTVRVVDAPEGVEDEDLGRGTLIGEMAMLVETTYGATVQALERVRALAFDRETLHELMEQKPAIAEHFSDMLLARLSDFAVELRNLDAQFAELEAAANVNGQA